MIEFEKMTHKDQITDNGYVVQKGTPITAEVLNRYEDVIDKLVRKVNELNQIICKQNK